MTSKPRLRVFLVGVAVVALSLVPAAPLYAAPSTETPVSLVSAIVDWWVRLGGRAGLDRDQTAASGTAAPIVDPDGVEAVPPMLPVNPDGYSAAEGDDGEAAPNMDPNG